MRKIFNVLNLNRMKFIDQQQQYKLKKQIETAQYSFKPAVTPKSYKLAQTFRTKDGSKAKDFSLPDYLISKGREYTSFKIFSQKKKNEEELERCTFRPVLTENSQRIVQVINVPVFQRLTENSNKSKICNRVQCIEALPNVTKEEQKEPKLKSKHEEAKGYESYIEYKMEIDEEKITAFGVDLKDYNSGVIPQLFIDVHLDDKSIHRLTIYEGDDPKSLAKNF